MPAMDELGNLKRPHDPLAVDFPRPQPKAEVAAQVCGICRKALDAAHAQLSCPACSQPYHEKCWEDNGGCAAYGCVQAGMMMPLPPLGPGETPPVAARAAEVVIATPAPVKIL